MLSIKNFGENLKKIRKVRGFTQQSLSEKAGVAYSYIVKIENSTDIPGNETILKICNALEIPMDFLLKDNGWRHYATYADSFIIKELAKLPQEEFDMLSKVLDLMIDMVKQQNGEELKENDKPVSKKENME